MNIKETVSRVFRKGQGNDGAPAQDEERLSELLHTAPSEHREATP